MASSLPQPEHRRATNDTKAHDDSWIDQTADRVAELLREEGLDLELIVCYDPLTETLHGVGFDGSPARYFASLESEPGTRPRAASTSATPLIP